MLVQRIFGETRRNTWPARPTTVRLKEASVMSWTDIFVHHPAPWAAGAACVASLSGVWATIICLANRANRAHWSARR